MTKLFHVGSNEVLITIIGRMYSVSPTQVELFHLRLLLLTIKGATSFEN